MIKATMRADWLLIRREPTNFVILFVMPILIATVLRHVVASSLREEHLSTTAGIQFAVVGQIVMFGIFGAAIAAFGVVRELEWNTWPRLRSSGHGVTSITLSKLLVPAALLAVQSAVTMAISVILLGFEVPRSRVVSLAAVALVGALLIAACGLALSVAGRNSQQVAAFANLGTAVFGIVGGAFVPLGALPRAMQLIAPALPTYWLMRAYRTLLVSPSVDYGTVATSLLVIVAMTFLALLIFARAVAAGHFDRVAQTAR